MAQFLDYDPLRGLAQYEDKLDGKLQVHYRQDVEPVLDLTKIERNNGLSDQAGKKQDFYLYARIPPVVILKLKYEYGIDIFSKDKGHLKKALDVINRDFPALKCTEKHHEIKNG